ncbi:hypothetical protein HD554DRAFT_2278109 [Boletus coccyginus]|nr:hypothetical protein HD554DRAFT_2278109 [Boletus coccyginus]
MADGRNESVKGLRSSVDRSAQMTGFDLGWGVSPRRKRVPLNAFSEAWRVVEGARGLRTRIPTLIRSRILRVQGTGVFAHGRNALERVVVRWCTLLGLRVLAVGGVRGGRGAEGGCEVSAGRRVGERGHGGGSGCRGRRQCGPVWRDPSGVRCGCDCDGGDVAVDFEGAVSAESTRCVVKAGRVAGGRWNEGLTRHSALPRVSIIRPLQVVPNELCHLRATLTIARHTPTNKSGPLVFGFPTPRVRYVGGTSTGPRRLAVRCRFDAEQAHGPTTEEEMTLPKSFEVPASPPDPLYKFPHEYSFYAALAGTPGHTPWPQVSTVRERSVTQARRAGRADRHTPKTRSFQSLGDDLTPALCRSMATVTPTTNQSGRYLQVPSPTPFWESDVNVLCSWTPDCFVDGHLSSKAVDEAGDVVSSDIVSSRSAWMRD